MKKVLKEIIKWIVRGALYIWFKIFYQAEIKGLEMYQKMEQLYFVETIEAIWIHH